MRTFNEQITPAEFQRHEWEVENRDAQFQHIRTLKEMEVHVLELEAKVSSWLRIPLKIIMLPVLLVMAVGYCIQVGRGNEPSQDFWDIIKR